jgi:hypothetical protein
MAARSYGTQGSMATRLGITQQRLSKLVRDPDWPVSPKAPWTEADAKTVSAWKEERRKLNGASAAIDDGEAVGAVGGDALAQIREMSPERKAKLQWLLTRTKKTQAELDEFLKNYIRRDEVEQQRTERVEAVKAALRALVHTLPPKVIGLGAEAVERVLEAEFRAVCNGFAGH